MVMKKGIHGNIFKSNVGTSDFVRIKIETIEIEIVIDIWKRFESSAARAVGTARQPHIIPFPAPWRNVGRLFRILKIIDNNRRTNRRKESTYLEL